MILLGCLGVMVAGLLMASHALRPIELATVDARFAVRGPQPARVRKLLIVAIDPETLDALGRFPIRRRYYAQALDRLRRDGARLVALDVQFTEPSDSSDDDALIAGLRRTPGTVLVTADTTARGGNDVLGGRSAQRYARVRVASVVLPLDAGDTYRRFDLVERGLPTLAVTAASVLQPGFSGSELGRAPVWIDYAGGPGTVPTVSMETLLAGRVPVSEIRGRIVVLGATDTTLDDLHNFSALDSRPMAGAEIEANAIETALEHAPLRDASGWIAALMTLAMVMLVPLAAVGRRLAVGAMVLIGSATVYLLLAQLLFDAGVIVPVANPIAGLIVVGAVAVAGTFMLEIRAREHQVRTARARAVVAADEARQRVERDLHDGVQQRLLALAMRLGAPGAAADPELLPGSVEQLKLALTELRQLVRGSHPAVLQEAGLPGALQSLADHAQLPVMLTIDGLDSLPDETARAAYFVAAEALANALKHAGASAVTIDAREARNELRLTVSDDGSGGADPAGNGLSGLEARAAAMGGSLKVTSAPRHGTELVLRIPLPNGPR